MRALLVILLFSAVGCTHVQVNRTDKVFGTGPQQVIELDSFAWGFVPVRIPAEAEVCPKSKIDSVNLYQDKSDVLLTAVTLGIYVPHRAVVACSPALSGLH